MEGQDILPKVGGAEGGERERIASRLPTEREAQCEAQSHNPEFMT